MITYKRHRQISADEFIDLLERSGLAERRPVHNREAMEAMVGHSNLCITAWSDGQLIGVARSLTDFHFCCYMSELAVDRAYQRKGIGQMLIRETQVMLAPGAKLLLLAAPAAAAYYPHIGFTKNDRCWEIASRPLITVPASETELV